MEWTRLYNTGDVLWLGDWSAPWIVALGVLGAAILGLSALDLWSMRPARRWTLVGLRVAVYTLAVVMLLEPAVDLKHVSKIKNHVAVLVDKSASMQLAQAQDSKQTRAQVATAALRALEPGLEQARTNHTVHLLWYGGTTALGADLQVVAEMPSTQRASDLSGALFGLKKTLGQEDLGGIVVLSDGIDTGDIGARTKPGEDLDRLSVEKLQALGAPVHTIATTEAASLRDLAISRVLRDDFAFVHNKTGIEVEVQVMGVETGEAVGVTLSREGEVLGTKQLTVRKGQTRYNVPFEFVPAALGKEVYTVSLPHLSGEALYENNTSHFLLRVIRDKIRVLQVVGRPSWDERFLRRLLKGNPNIDLISFFILRSDTNLQRAASNEMSLIPFPTRELFEQELGSFDLIVFQNFNFGPYTMGQYLPRIADFVKKGGGFVMVGGDLSFASGGYAGTPIEEILPVSLPSGLGQGELIEPTPFRPKLTPAGQRHPITQLAFDPRANTELWAKLPAQRGTNLVSGAAPGATVLLTHPDQRGPDGKPMPVLTVGEREQGRVMALTTDSSWRWGFESLGEGGTLREYQLFWSNAMRWLIKDPELKLLRIDLAQDRYLPGDTIAPVIKLYRPDYQPQANQEGTLHVSWRPFGAEAPPAEPTTDVVPFVTDSLGQALPQVAVTKPGIYTLEAKVTPKEGGGELEDQTLALVVQDLGEWRSPIPRDDLLRQISQATGGQAAAKGNLPGSMPFKESQSVRVNRRKVIGLWDSTWCFLLILVLLATEWSCRKRWGRL